jgi:hypothetical protein
MAPSFGYYHLRATKIMNGAMSLKNKLTNDKQEVHRNSQELQD